MARQKYKRQIFTIKAADGRKARCVGVAKQDYSDCRISAGLVQNLPPEDIFLSFQRPYKEPSVFYLRRDEAIAAAWVITGALWSDAMDYIDKDGQHMDRKANR